MADPADITELRLLVAEVIPEGGDETNTLFLDSQLNSIYDRAGNLAGAAADAWRAKAASLARLVDAAEGDSFRKLSQRFTNAQKMIEVWSGVASTDADTRVAVVGVAVDILRPNSNEEALAAWDWNAQRPL